MAEKIIAIVGLSVLFIVCLPALIVVGCSIGSIFVDIFVDMWATYKDFWKKAIEVIRQVLKGGEGRGRKKDVHKQNR